MSTSRQLPPVSQPPWLWLYLGFAATRVIPSTVNTLREDWAQFDTVQEQIPDVASLRLLMVAEAVPILLILGILVVAFPALRRWLVERHHAPIQPSGEEPGPEHELRAQIQGFVDRHAPGVEIRFTSDAGGQARIYPVTWRRARIMLFGGFLKLWVQHRREAEAVLFHEIAHRRQGEHLIAGLGSPFSWLVRLWAAAYLILSVPLVVLLISNHSWLSASAMAQLLYDATTPIGMLIFPVAALWLAEFTADRWAADRHGADVVRQSLALARPAKSGGVLSRVRRILSVLDHPPARLRRALLSSRHSRTLLLASWPATVVPAFLVSVMTMVPVTLLLGWRASDQPGVIAFGGGVALDSALAMLIASLLLLVSWPLLSTRWPRIWTPSRAQEPGDAVHSSVSRPATKPYLLASVLPAMLILGSLLPAPGMPAPERDTPAAWVAPMPSPTLRSFPTASTSTSVPSTPAQTSTSPDGIPTSDAESRPELVGQFTVFWNPPGAGTFTHEAELSLSGTTGAARIRVYVSGSGMVDIDEDLSLTQVQEQWWYAGSNPVVHGIEAEYLPDYFMLEQRSDKWTISHVCTSTDATVCYPAWGDLDRRTGDTEGTASGPLDAVTCAELERQADHFDELAEEAERLADEMTLDSTKAGLLANAEEARASAQETRQKMADGGCT
jgi:Zn-dependent protease with chaperone function